MIYGMDTQFIAMLAFAIVAGAYFMASAMDGVMGPDGFGTILNMIILVAGGVIGLYAVDYFRFAAGGVTMQAVAGVTGGFMSLAILATLKSLANRIGY